jgi:uncharacterized protein YdaU (DUF1376 family)
VNFFKLYIGDYQRDTGHLSVTEHGAYLLMLQHYYATEKPLPTGKALHRLLRAQDKTERDAIDAVVGMFWEESTEGLVNARADEEIRKGSHQREINREIGKRGGRPKKTESVTESDSESEPNRNPNQTPDTREEHSSLRSEARKRTPDDVTVPDWVPVVSWRAFVQHRKDIRKPLTAKAAELAIAELENLKAQGHEPAAVINQSIVSRWAGLFPLKGGSHVKPTGTGNAGRSLSAPERVAAAIAERDAASGRTLEHGAAG